MSDEDRPPTGIWLEDEALEAHFDEVRRRYRGGTGTSESVPLEQNELTRGLR